MLKNSARTKKVKVQAKVEKNESDLRSTLTSTSAYLRAAALLDGPFEHYAWHYPIVLGACPTLTVLLRRTIRDHLRRARPEKILNAFQ
jgi:hypothetical protein